MNSTKIISVYLPLTAGLLIFLGSLKLYSYYSNYNIPIFNYVSLSELIVYFMYLLQDIKYYAVGFVVGLLLCSFLSVRIFSSWWNLGISILLIIMGLALYKTSFTASNVHAIRILVILGCFLFAKFLINKPFNQFSELIIISGFMAYLIFYTFTASKAEYIETQETKYFKGTTIYFKDSTFIISNDSVFYIGNTEKYIYVHYDKGDSTVVFHIEDIKRIVFPVGKKGFFEK